MSDTPAPVPLDIRLTGPVIVALAAMVAVSQWGGPIWADTAAALLLPVLIAIVAPRVRRGRLIFVAVALVLSGTALLTLPEGGTVLRDALARGAFIAAFFAALTSLRHAADGSPAIRTCGMYLAHQPPGRRYIALSMGGQMFALLLNYGSIALLGSLATAAAREEPDPEIRRHRMRRMLLAIQRGFGSMLPWSPLAFAVAIMSSLIPGVSWGRTLPYALVSSVLLVGIGWALDSIFKPRLARPAPRHGPQEGETWRALLPLAGLLVLLMSLALGLHEATGLRITAILLVLVPLIATLWFALQGPEGGRFGHGARRLGQYVQHDLPRYRDELLLLSMAAFIGSIGAVLLTPVIDRTGFDLHVLPGWAVLVAVVWLMPLTGQLGMNPILSATLIYPFVPDPSVLGVTPTAVFIAFTGGWALSGSNSPFAATTLLLGNFAGISAFRVGWQWNGVYTLCCGVALSLWVAAMAAWGLG
jgi:hypothetical protein